MRNPREQSRYERRSLRRFVRNMKCLALVLVAIAFAGCAGVSSPLPQAPDDSRVAPIVSRVAQ